MRDTIFNNVLAAESGFIHKTYLQQLLQSYKQRNWQVINWLRYEIP